jgi:hypothetical protein
MEALTPPSYDSSPFSADVALFGWDPTPQQSRRPLIRGIIIE